MMAQTINYPVTVSKWHYLIQFNFRVNTEDLIAFSYSHREHFYVNLCFPAW